jgi:hypothetical protein
MIKPSFDDQAANLDEMSSTHFPFFDIEPNFFSCDSVFLLLEFSF